jgi:hypothetical protein
MYLYSSTKQRGTVLLPNLVLAILSSRGNMSSNAAGAAFAASAGRVAAVTGANKGVGFFIGESTDPNAQTHKVHVLVEVPTSTS